MTNGKDVRREVRIRAADLGDGAQLVHLVGAFRVALAQLRGTDRAVDLEAAGRELAEYQRRRHEIFVAEHGRRLVGYLVCRVDGDVVWAESLFVLPGERREGIGSALYAQAERLARERGSDTVYNWVHPNNDQIIAFLRRRGYTVLNLIELRRAYPGEEIRQRITVGKHNFDY